METKTRKTVKKPTVNPRRTRKCLSYVPRLKIKYNDPDPFGTGRV